jgi:monoterpene epsilon-lactone hydrolase
MVSPEAQRAIARIRAASSGPKLALADDRAQWVASSLDHMLPDGAVVTEAVVGGIAGEWIDIKGASSRRVILQLHGGGYNAGSPVTHRKLGAYYALHGGARVFTPDYRLAPEHPFPAAPDDCLAVYGALLGQGIDPGDIVFVGDSAGGGLALTVLLMLRERGAPMPAAAVLIAPMADLTASSESYERNRASDPQITRESIVGSGVWYAGERDRRDPLLSPLFADLKGLPPLLVHAGSIEVMLDEAQQLAEHARIAGVDVTFKIWPGLWHVHHHDVPDVPEATEAIREIGAFIRALDREAAA